MRSTLLLLTAFLTLVLSATAQKSTLSYDQIFHHPPAFTQPLPNIVRWIDDDHYLQRKDNAGSTVFVEVDAATGSEKPYQPGSAPSRTNPLPPSGANPPPPSSTTEKNLPADALNVEPSPDGKWIAYTRANNLFAKEQSTGKEIRFTNDGSENIYNGYAAYVYYEEILHKGTQHRAFWWSPDSRHIAFIHFDETDVPVFSIFHSEGSHGFLEKQRYPQAGDKNPKVKMGIVSVDAPSIVWADFNEADDQYFHIPYWTPDGSALWVQWMPRSQKELKIYSVDPHTGDKKEVYDEKQKTWVWEKYPDFLENGRQFLISSDKSGWSHLYLYNMDGTLVNQVTKGDFSVGGTIHIDERNKVLYFLARKENSARYDLYRIGFDGNGMTRLSFGNYTHDQVLASPHGKYFITTYSNLSTPPKMSLLDNKGRRIRELGDSKGADYDKYKLAKVELLRVRSRDSLFDLPMKITYPLNFDPAKKYPVLVTVYGGPGLGLVYDKWSPELRPQWWAKEGMVQVTIDDRSSGHFGKKGMEYIYKQAGKPEVEDFIDCARWLRRQSFIDTTRVGIYGYSFGGFMVCMALTYGADVFNYGLAYYPLVDWRLYDSYYSETFMGTPQENPEGYKAASPLNYVNNYKGLLRIVHGNIDNNCHLQNTLQLVNKLEDLDRHFELKIYPGERHGRGSWSDAKRTNSYNEDVQFIYDHLLRKPMPAIFWK
ncbi:MAG TPA: DPP IV N-terminal domain-containing protein [Puia sp.]|jgi:dipeptidyl-peptidase-4